MPLRDAPEAQSLALDLGLARAEDRGAARPLRLLALALLALAREEMAAPPAAAADAKADAINGK